MDLGLIALIVSSLVAVILLVVVVVLFTRGTNRGPTGPPGPTGASMMAARQFTGFSSFLGQNQNSPGVVLFDRGTALSQGTYTALTGGTYYVTGAIFYGNGPNNEDPRPLTVTVAGRTFTITPKDQVTYLMFSFPVTLTTGGTLSVTVSSSQPFVIRTGSYLSAFLIS
jgi:hypothetical protein